MKQFATFFIVCFCVWFFKMEFNPFPDLLNTGLTLVEIDLFCGERLEPKICRFHTFLDNMAMFIEDDDVWKHFKYWLSSSNPH